MNGSIHQLVALRMRSISILIVFCCLIPVSVLAQTLGVEARTLQGLKQRRLFDLAASYGQELLKDTSMDSSRQVNISVALIDALTQKAWHSRVPQAWEEARRIAAGCEAEIQSPRKILVSVQAALIDQTRVEQWVRETELGVADEETRDAALVLVSRVVARFEELQKEIARLLNRRPGSGESEPFSPHELLTLRYNLEYQQAMALLHRAMLYGADEELSRNDVLTLVEQQLGKVLQAVGPEHGLWWTVQADRIAVARTMGDFQWASTIVQGLPRDAVFSTHDRLTAEWIRTLVARHDYEAAVAIAGKGSLASDSARLDLARVELFVAMSSRQANDGWQQRALDLTREIEETHGGYWARLANLSVVGTIASAPEAGSSLDLLIRVADEAQRKKQWDDALRSLDAAARKAAKTGKTEIAWRLGFRAASIEQQQEHFDKAAQRFETLAKLYPDSDESPGAWLMACWNAAKTIGNDRPRFERYEKMLQFLVESWPESAAADQGRIWLALIRKNQKNWPEAVSLLLNVNSASPLFGKAVAEVRIVTRQFSSQTDIQSESKGNLHLAVTGRLLPLLSVDDTGMPDNWAESRHQVVLQLAELKYVYGTESIAGLSTELDGVIEDLSKQATANRELLSTVLAIRLVSVAIDPGAQPDQAVFANLQAGPEQLGILLHGLSSELPDPTHFTKSRLLLSVADRFANEIGELPPSQRRQWGLAKINAMITTGPSSEFEKKAQLIADQFPRDAAIQIGMAKMLTRLSADDGEWLTRAIGQWRRVVQFSRPNSPSWFAAKYQVAKLLSDQGRTDDALKLLRFIRAVPPGWTRAENAERFDELFSSLGGQ